MTSVLSHEPRVASQIKVSIEPEAETSLTLVPERSGDLDMVPPPRLQLPRHDTR